MGTSICTEAKSTRHDENSTIPRYGQDIKVADEVEASDSVEASQPMRLNSQFIFDLPFLKKRLAQVNYMGKEDRFFRQGSGTENAFVDKVNWKRESVCSHNKELSR